MTDPLYRALIDDLFHGTGIYLVRDLEGLDETRRAALGQALQPTLEALLELAIANPVYADGWDNNKVPIERLFEPLRKRLALPPLFRDWLFQMSVPMQRRFQILCLGVGRCEQLPALMQPTLDELRIPESLREHYQTGRLIRILHRVRRARGGACVDTCAETFRRIAEAYASLPRIGHDELEEIPVDALIEALRQSTDTGSDEGLSGPGLPEMLDKAAFLARRDGLARDVLIELIVDKLNRPLGPQRARDWSVALAHFDFRDAELARYQDRLIGLLSAPAPATVRAALEAVGTRLLARDPSPHRVALIGGCLHHQTQPAAKAAFRALKRAKLPSEAQASAYRLAADALVTPHDALRRELIAWLAKTGAERLDARILEQLQAIAPELPAVDRDALQPLLGSPLPTPAPSVDTARDRERLDRLLADESPPADSPLQRHRLDYLRAWRAGDPMPLEATIPPIESILSASPFECHETPEMFATNLADRDHRRRPGAWERIRAGFLRFAVQPPSPRVRKILARVLKDQELQECEEAHAVNVPFPRYGLKEFSVAHVWLHGRVLDFPAGSRGAWRFEPLDHALVKGLLRLRDLGCEVPPSLPTHRDGWLDPLVFAERLARLPRDAFDHWELASALWRLPSLPSRSNRLQATEQAAAGWIGEAGVRDDGTAAVALALGPAELLPAAMTHWTDRLTRNPPNLAYFHTRHPSSGPDYRLDKAQIGAEQYHPDNIRFCLFSAALRCRCGLGDTRDLVPDTLRRRVGEVIGRRFGSSRTSLFDDLFWHPEPVSTRLAQRLAGPVYAGRHGHYSAVGRCAELAPYLGHGFPTGLQGDRWDHAHPGLRQRVLEAACCDWASRSGAPDGTPRRDAPIPSHWFCHVGGYPELDPRHRLAPLLAGMASGDAKLREETQALFCLWLRDGRATPARLASTIAEYLSGLRQGVKNLDRSFASLSESGEDIRHVLVAGLERLLAEQGGSLKGRPLTTWLQRLTVLYERDRRTVHHSGARTTLGRLAAAKGKSSAKLMAAELCSRGGPPAIDPETMAVLALCAGAAVG